MLLHRYAGDAVDGPFTHYTVTLAETDDGFGDLIPVAFQPDADTAAADSSGLIVKFYTNTAYPGTEDPAQAPCGWVVSRYLNGLEDLTGDNDYDMLDGMLVATETYDAAGTLVQLSLIHI